MAILVIKKSAVIEATNAATVTTSGGDDPWTSTTGNLLVAIGSNFGATTEGATPMADGGTNTFTASKSSNVGTGPQFVDIAYAKNITGKATERATYTIGSTQFPSVFLLEASGCDTTSPNDVVPSFTSATSGTTVTTTLITPAAGDHLIVMCGCADGSGTFNQSIADAGTSGIGTGAWTSVKNDSNAGNDMLIAYAIVTADGVKTYGLTYTHGSSAGLTSAITGIAAFKAPAASQDTPELYGRPHGTSGQRQMQQLLAQ